MTIKYSSTLAPYAVGRRANSEEWNSITRTAEGVVKFGVAVKMGSGDHGCAEMSATNDKILGISEAAATLPANAAAPADQYEIGDNVAICEYGVIAVVLAKSVTAGTQARYIPASGKWTDASQSNSIATIPGAQFETSGGADGAIGLIRYRRPAPSVALMV